MLKGETSTEAFKDFKKVLFSKLTVDLEPGKSASYLDGVVKHPGQSEIHFTDWSYFVAMWGRRTGKTISAAAEVVATMAQPQARIWIVAPTYELTDRVFEYVYRWLVLDKVLGKDSIVKASKTRELRYIETQWGSFVKGKSGEAPNSLIGDQLDLLVIDEAARIEPHIYPELLEPTTLDRNGRTLFISTPRGRNWFYDYFVRKDKPETKNKGWCGSQFRTQDNPFLNKEWIKSKKSETPPDIWRREYEASPEHFSGLVWSMFTDKLRPDGHLFKASQGRPSGTIYRAIDIGWRHPTFALWAVVDEKGDVWVFQEYHGKPDTIHLEHAKNIFSMSAGMKIYDTWISPDARRKHPVATRAEDTISVFDIYNDNGIDCRLALDDWKAGAPIVGSYLQAALQANSSHPRVFVAEECVSLRHCLQNYVYQDTFKSREDQPEKPKKYKDDAADAFRYLLAPMPRYSASEDLEGSSSSYMEERYGWPVRKVILESRKSDRIPGAPYIAGI
jgi:hypothetical protein